MVLSRTRNGVRRLPIMDIFNLTQEDVRKASSKFLRSCLKEDIDVDLHDTISYELFEVRGE